MDLEIKGFIPNTMLDWEGMLASTVFLPGCNFRCPYCQNPDLVLHPESLETVSPDLFKDFLCERRGWIDGVVISGGEPCLQKDLRVFCGEVKNLGFDVKLDTNGSMPEVLESLMDEGLLDFVAMDIKAPLESGPYRLASGNKRSDLVELVRSSIRLISASGIEHEFRTTVVPILHCPEDVKKIAEELDSGEHYVLQNFSPKVTIDPRFAELKPFTEDDMEAMLNQARQLVPGTVMRGAPAGIQT